MTAPMPVTVTARRHQLRFTLHQVLPEQWTVFRQGAGQRAPDPQAYGAFGDNTWIVPPIHIPHPERLRLGNDAVIMEYASILVGPGATVILGNGSHLARFATIHATVGVHIGNDVLTSDSISITDTWGPVAAEDAASRGRSGHHHTPAGRAGHVPRDVMLTAPRAPSPVVIDDGAYLGANCIIGPGVRVGAGAFVGEGAVVYDDVAPHSVVYGNPAITVRRLEGGAWSDL